CCQWSRDKRTYTVRGTLISQQPVSIPTEIRSQGDNWFIFHLLSAADLVNVNRANAHFSEDLLSTLLNEPIPGQGLFWSSVGGSPFPIPIRAVSFDAQHPRQDKDYTKAAVATYATSLKQRLASVIDVVPAPTLHVSSLPA